MALALVSCRPVSTDYLELLQRDLDQALLIRFAVAYVSEAGIQVGGEDRLLAALEHPKSFGIATMDCGCGFWPFLKLQAKLDQEDPKLKYFFDPKLRKDRNEQSAPASLMHTKMVYLVRRDNKAVVYIGSHNWSKRALGPKSRPRNAEASLRIELPATPGDLDGTGTGLGPDVNRHLTEINWWKLSLPAIPDNEPKFMEWSENACGGNSADALEDYSLVLCVAQQESMANQASIWRKFRDLGHGIYLQILREDDGPPVWSQSERIAVLVWPSLTAMKTSKLPLLLLCQSTNRFAGPESEIAGTSQGDFQGFRAVLWDPKQHAALAKNKDLPDALSATARSGRKIEYFSFDLRPGPTVVSQVDQSVVPRYRHYLQVQELILPDWLASERPADVEIEIQEGETPRRRERVWRPGQVGFSSSRQVRMKKSPGYRVDRDQHLAMEECLRDVFKVQPTCAHLRPYSDPEDECVGLRLASHPVHEALIDDEAAVGRADRYRSLRRGSVVPAVAAQGGGAVSKKLALLERVSTAYAESLEKILTQLEDEIQPP